ncbi:MAG: glycogen synthase GlgA [bacterium]|nr:glycogen synthase GlgA [bacterium]MDD5354646.1 glycogen synthase GlgA [bacterium]MDD5756019.1 glycogen synthase GlgA [bacterium]
MKIVITASECVPFVKTGGLADVAGALAKILKKEGHKVVVFLPKYKKVDAKTYALKTVYQDLQVPVGEKIEKANIQVSTKVEGIPVYFIDNPGYFDRDELYRTANGDYEDNGERFIFFSHAVLEALKAIDFQPDIIHAHDWQVGMVPTYLKTSYKYDAFFAKTATVFTIHNLAYQGSYPREAMFLTGVSVEEFTPEKLEFYGNMCILKGGIVYSDIVTTVSKKYAQEILTPEFGRGLDGVLLNRQADLYGIINGIDYDEWDPKTDKFVPVNYDLKTIAKKEEGKKLFLESCKLPYNSKTPVIGIVSRLDPQKGFDILGEAMNELMKLDFQFVLLGKGDADLQGLFTTIGRKYPKKTFINIGFDNKVAHQIYAGCDMFLMPSYFEPCGLGQLISLKYGTVPIVHETGGLADTIKEFSSSTGKGNGISFKDYNASSLIQAVKRALALYQKKADWNKVVANGLKSDFSWEKVIPEYIDLYKKAAAKKENS